MLYIVQDVAEDAELGTFLDYAETQDYTQAARQAIVQGGLGTEEGGGGD